MLNDSYRRHGKNAVLISLMEYIFCILWLGVVCICKDDVHRLFPLLVILLAKHFKCKMCSECHKYESLLVNGVILLKLTGLIPMITLLLKMTAWLWLSQALKIKKKLGGEQDEEGNGSADKASKEGRAKRYYCTVCPYRTDKRSMLTFHHTYHQPSSQNKYKCKFCPYYVCAPRLLHQHIKWHEEIVDDQATLDSLGWRASAGEKTPPSSPSKRGKVSFESSAKRHICEKCPYTTNSKNDFLYHKQFHRPKPSAEYKCEHCDYWVTHRRLLRQHARLHGEEFADDSVTSSPTKSLTSDASAVLDAVEIAAIKQKMITNKITASLSTSPAVSPMKIAAQCTAGNRPGFVLRDGVYKKLHKCSKCPYTNIRSRNVRLHELMHGWRRSDHALMKCPHCDYYVGAKGLLSHHMKVHNRQYQPDPSDSVTFDLERREKAPGAARISVESEDDHNYIFTSREIPQQHKVRCVQFDRIKPFCHKYSYGTDWIWVRMKSFHKLVKYGEEIFFQILAEKNLLLFASIQWNDVIACKCNSSGWNDTDFWTKRKLLCPDGFLIW